jgi:predicted transcriptional regulator
MITLRLDSALEKNLTDMANILGLTKSELIRRSLFEYLEKIRRPSAWELGEDKFGRYASGKGNLSSDRKVLLKEKIKSKRV